MWLALSGVCAAVLSLAGIYLYLDPQIPRAETYRQVRLETPLRVYTADRELIAEFGERRLVPITLDQVPKLFVRAVLDTEDKRFYEHSGVDLITLATSAWDLIVNMGEITRGGSTITMQLPRNIGTFSLDQLFIRKFKEILLALKIERELSKDEILELYINAVPFGKRAHGAQAAALTYYGKPLQELSLPQLAMLAGIPQAPTAGNPINNLERATRRRNLVLTRMLEQRSISREQFEAAVATADDARLHERALEVNSPFPAEWVRQQLLPRYPDLYSGGYQVITTLDGDLQRVAITALRAGLTSYDRRHGYRGPEAELGPADREVYLEALRAARRLSELRPAVITTLTDDHAQALLGDGREIRLDMEGLRWARPFLTVNARGAAPRRPADVFAVGDLIRVREVPPSDPAEPAQWQLAQVPEVQGALVSLDPKTGAVRSMVGGYDFAVSQYNHVLQAARQPGSGFKPFVYSAALAAGLTPASVFMDAPLVFRDNNLESEYRPDNDNNRYNGPTRLREALYRSINLVSMRVLLEVGAANVLGHVRAFGFDTSNFPRNTQLAIGGGTMAVTPMQMARAYTVFANGGHRIEPHIIDEVQDISGRTLFKARHPVVCNACRRAPDDEQTPADAEPEPEREPANLQELLALSALEPARRPDIERVALVAPAPPLEDAQPLLAEQVLDERIAYLMSSMLRDVVRRGTATRARALERSDLAGKTGTTDDAADTWFHGYNADLVTTVWVGRPDHGPLGAREYGSNTPLPIWIDYMAAALDGKPETLPAQPPGVTTMKIDPDTGRLADPGDPDAIFEYFLEEHAPAPAPRSGSDSRGDDEISPVEIF